MKVITYYRVSTAGQGRSGLGLDAQRAEVARYCQNRSCDVLAEYQDVESGKRNERPALGKALHHAKVTGATLVVAKMDRLSRNAAFLLTLRGSRAKFVAADNPDVNDMTVGILAVVAEGEREAIATRTREALQAAKARGVRLGNPNGAAALRRAAKGNTAALAAIRRGADGHASEIAPIIDHLRAEGRQSLRELASALNERHIRTPRGGAWHPTSVKNLLARINLATNA